MVSLKHRAMESLVKRNPGELLVRDLAELRQVASFVRGEPVKASR